MRVYPLALFMSATLPLATGATAAEDIVFKTVGEWTVLTQSDDAITCYASRKMEDGSEVQIGFDLDQKQGFFAIYNAAWTDIKDGDTGTVEFNFGSSRFGGDAVGKTDNGVPGGYAVFDNPAFVEAFANGQSVKISGSKGVTFDMSLTGTKNAIIGVRDCQKTK